MRLTQHVTLDVCPSASRRYGFSKTARRIDPSGNFEIGPRENQTGGVLRIRLEKMNPIIGIPIMNAAIVLITKPTFSKKSRRVEWFFASERTEG
jgi:hypothetical protein